MTNLYRLVKAHGFCFRTFGIVGGVRVNEPDMVSQIEKRLPPGWRRQRLGAVGRLYSFFFNRASKSTSFRRFHILYGNSQILARSENEEELLEEFERRVTSHIFETCRSKCFVHAGVVGWKGKAIVIPGRSHSGKTTLVKEFLKQGARYYSDEFAVFDRRGYVHAFARPLAVRDENNGKQIRLPATVLRCQIGVQSLPVGLILLTEYKASASWRPRMTSSGKAVLKLLANAISARTDPSGALASLVKAASRAKILRSVRGEAHDAVRSILADKDLFTPALPKHTRVATNRRIR